MRTLNSVSGRALTCSGALQLSAVALGRDWKGKEGSERCVF